MRTMIITLKNEKARYEIFMRGIKKSNIDDEIVGYELRYDCFQKLTFGSSLSTDNILHEPLEKFISDLLLKGFKKVA